MKNLMLAQLKYLLNQNPIIQKKIRPLKEKQNWNISLFFLISSKEGRRIKTGYDELNLDL